MTTGTIKPSVRVGADIGGTFTDIALESGDRIFSAKLLTTSEAPEQAVLDGIALVLGEAGLEFSDIDIVIHGTTLATNALIERRGAKTALLTTKGFRDVIEMRFENRFEQYDLDIVLPKPLIDRADRLVVGGRIGAEGDELAPLDETALVEIAGLVKERGYQSLAIGLIHSYANPAHEARARDILRKHLPDISISISSEVSPQMREFERFNTVCVNAYVRPRMEDYLARLESELKTRGAKGALYMIHSGGGLISVETAKSFPVRLVESGPAGGAIFAADYAARFGLDKVLSYDMGGTTAKICLIDNAIPETARTFEVARTTRFKKGSGMPISIPVIEMVEIGAGGGSLASVDAMGRIQVGPESAGSEPGPACYQRGGEAPAITDADLLLGKIDADDFAGGDIQLSITAARSAIQTRVGKAQGLSTEAAAFGICEMVDENMANAARMHAVESGKDITGTTMIAFGGAAPLHAARLCEKLGVSRCLIPPGAGIGSAIGFLRAPFAFEAVRTQLMRLSEFDAASANDILQDLREAAIGFVAPNADGAKIDQETIVYMRYQGQGWEIPVELPDQTFSDTDSALFLENFRAAYTRFFGRAIDGLGGVEIEIVTWSARAAANRPPPDRITLSSATGDASPAMQRDVFDPAAGDFITSGIHARGDLKSGDRVSGPAVIMEKETSTILTSAFDAVMQDDGSILIHRKDGGAS